MDYYQKYLKYKEKYLNLKKMSGGAPKQTPKNEAEFLDFAKDIALFNARLRFIGKSWYADLVKTICSLGDITQFKELIFENSNYKELISKGYQPLYNLAEFILFDEIKSRNPNSKALLIAQFIVINQIFGDGNHRTAQYVLDNYSDYTYSEKEIIKRITEQIHEYTGDYKNLWVGDYPFRKSNLKKMLDDPEISGLLKK